MKKLLLATVALAALLTPALAGEIWIRAQEDGGAFVDFGPGAGQLSASGSTTNFSTITADGTTKPLLPDPLQLDSHTLAVDFAGAGASHTLDVWVTAEDLTGNLDAFLNTYTSNRLNVGWTVLAETLVSTTNQRFAGTSISDITFNSIGIDIETANFSTGVGPYSITSHWLITSDGTSGSASLTTVTSAVAVPGPIVGAGIPGILAMFGMGGWAWRRKLWPTTA
jgi:hypothetical protein